MTLNSLLPTVCRHHDGDANEHTHAQVHCLDGVEHPSDYTHVHSHDGGDHVHTHDGAHGDHDHSHDCTHECGTCGGCDPMTETVALMQYMVNHNAAHARELADLAKKLGELGNHAASEQVLAAVSEFEKGNLRLSAVLASLK